MIATIGLNITVTLIGKEHFNPHKLADLQNCLNIMEKIIESLKDGQSVTIMGNTGIIYNGIVRKGEYKTKTGEYFYVETNQGSFAKGEINKFISPS